MTYLLSFSSVVTILCLKSSLTQILLCVRGQSRITLSKSNEPISTRGSISVHIAFSSFLASPVCIMQCNAFYSIFRTMCDYRPVPGVCVPDHLL